MPNRNGVIINVYIESTNLRPDPKTYPIKRINRKQISTQRHVFKKRGYDRRAQLLAYAQELRHADAQQLHWPLKDSSRKPKKWRWKVAVEKIKRLFSPFDDRMKRKWKYESIETDDYSDGEESCNQERMKKSTKGRRRRRHFHFCKKLRCLLKKISRAWKCKFNAF